MRSVIVLLMIIIVIMTTMMFVGAQQDDSFAEPQLQKKRGSRRQQQKLFANADDPPRPGTTTINMDRDRQQERQAQAQPNIPPGPDPHNPGRIQLSPELEMFDLTRGVGPQHPMLGPVHSIHLETKKTKHLFLAAQESDSIPQLMSVAEKLVPELQTKLFELCDKVSKEVDRHDRTSGMLRDQVRELNEKMSATALAGRSGLQQEMQKAAMGLRDSEDRFMQVRLVQHICSQTSTMLEHLAVEADMVSQEIKSRKQDL